MDVNAFIPLAGIFDKPAPRRVDVSHGSRTFFQPGETVVAVRDDFENANCVFLRATGPAPLRLGLDGGYRLTATPAGGWLAKPQTDGPTYWLPVLPRLRRLDQDAHVLEERDTPLRKLDVSAERIEAEMGVPEGWALDVVIWRLSDASDLDDLTPVETAGYFSWGSHTCYRKPADVYQHVIHGWVYENRSSWPRYWKIASENDAHALCVTLSGIERATGKDIYKLLKLQLLLSVLDRQSEDGAFRHGEWTHTMESHYRLHVSAMHLLMDAYAEKAEPVVRTALERAAAFVARKADQTDFGAWFLHDDLELNPEALNKGPFKWLPSRACGKSPTNMLVLNTHLDTIVALDRFRELTGDTTYAGLVESARACTRSVLALRPAEWLYSIVIKIAGLTLLPTRRAEALPLPARALKRIGWRYLTPNLCWLKTRFPRLVMPGGYIDRALSLKGWADHYLTINAMDLARFHRRFPDDGVMAYLVSALDFAENSRVAERWAELKYEKYALGFLAEALYQTCLLSPEPRWRDRLAAAVLMLEDLGMGIPPSLLGANTESVPLPLQSGCPIATDGNLRVINLSSGKRREYLVVNPTGAAGSVRWATDPGVILEWFQSPGNTPVSGPSPQVPSRGWVQGLGQLPDQ